MNRASIPRTRRTVAALTATFFLPFTACLGPTSPADNPKPERNEMTAEAQVQTLPPCSVKTDLAVHYKLLWLRYVENYVLKYGVNVTFYDPITKRIQRGLDEVRIARADYFTCLGKLKCKLPAYDVPGNSSQSQGTASNSPNDATLKGH